jgi:integrase
MTRRREQGEGSVFRRGNGRVVGEYEDATGKRRYISGKTKPEVRKRLRKLLEDRDKGIAHDSENLTVAAYMDRWLESIRDKVRPGTYKPYEAITRLHIKPTLGKKKLDKLTALQLETLYRQKLDAGLSARRVRYIHVTIRKALKDAVRLQLLSRNVADTATSGQARDKAAHATATTVPARRRQRRQARIPVRIGDNQRHEAR